MVLFGKEHFEKGCLEMLALLLDFSGQNDICRLEKLSYMQKVT